MRNQRWALQYNDREIAHLSSASLNGANLHDAVVVGADLREASLRGANLDEIVLGDKYQVGPSLVDVQWGNSNLALADWSQISILGEEREANQPIHIKTDFVDFRGKKKSRNLRLMEYKDAVQAYRQLTIALQAHGLNEDASRFTYRAQLMQRKVLWYQRKYGQYLFSSFLDLLSGYGYKPVRCFIAYLLVILTDMGSRTGLVEATDVIK